VTAAKTRNGQAARETERRVFFNRLLGIRKEGQGAGIRERPSAEQIALIREVAARWQAKLPPGTVPELQVGEACLHHRVCVAVCPTQALRPYAGNGHAGLDFDAAACIACGVCALVCPENALTLRAVPAAPARAPRPVSRHATRACQRCDNEFAARGEEELCPACRKDVQLFTTGFSARSNGP
jgi:Fe-S-cluster-containing dehydrogenase component